MTLPDNPNFLGTQGPKVIGTKKFGCAALCLSMANFGTDSSRDVAIRCRVLTRIYAGGNSTVFAAMVGLTANRWNNIENSGAVSKDATKQIIRKFPEVSIDWLWRGKDDGLPKNRIDDLTVGFRQVLAEMPVKAPKRKRAAS